MEITIPKYIRRVKLSDSRRAKFYTSSKPPKAKKYQDRTKYDWKIISGKNILVHVPSGQPVIANPKAIGTPKIQLINGQALYNGQVAEQTRAKMMNAIKDSFKEYVDQLDEITEFPVRIEAELHDTITSGDSLWDLDNRAWPYVKAFQDCLTGNKTKEGVARNKVIIPDDNILYVTQPAVPRFIPVDSEEDRKLVFRIVKETDEKVLNHPAYCNPSSYEIRRILTPCKQDMENL